MTISQNQIHSKQVVFKIAKIKVATRWLYTDVA